MLATAGLADPVKGKAERLKAAIGKRVDAIFAVSGELAKNDPVLADYYEPLYTKQLKGHPRENELRELFAAARKTGDAKKAVALYKEFQKGFHGFFTEASPKPSKEGLAFFEKAKAVVSEESQFGRMVREYLDVK